MTQSVACVDTQPLLLAGLRVAFRNSAEHHVVAMGRSVRDAVEIARKHHPTLLVMDIDIAGDAISAVREILAASPATNIIAFTATAVTEVAVRAIEAGVRAYVLKNSTVEEFMTAVSAVTRGETFISPCFAASVITALRTATLQKTTSGRLTVREAQIVHLLLKGRTNREIAKSLNISEKTVKHYMTVLMQKLQVKNRLEVVIAAQQMSGTPHHQQQPMVKFYG